MRVQPDVAISTSHVMYFVQNVPSPISFPACFVMEGYYLTKGNANHGADSANVCKGTRINSHSGF